MNAYMVNFHDNMLDLLKSLSMYKYLIVMKMPIT
jgi:hypothetical protein